MEIDSWKAFKNLFRVIPMIVMTRAGQVSESTDLQLRKIENFLKNKVAKGYCFSTSKLHFTHNQMQPVFIAKVKHVNISSTNIRTLIKSHGSVCNFVPAEVESFIKNRGLYL
jgi:nicotinic acid mononucleotide adenylyltransferase